MVRIACLLFAFFISVKAEDSTQNLSSLLKQRLELYKALNKTKTQWQDEKASYEARISLKKSELNFLKEKIAAKKKAQLDGEKSLSDRQKDLQLSQEKISALHKSLDDIQSTLFKRVEALPKSLQDILAIVEDVKKASVKREAKHFTSRLQLLKALAKDLSQLQQGSHLVEEILDLGGKKQEAQVLYLGSAIAYYLSRDGLQAGLIVFENGGWRVKPENTLVSEVQKALNVLQQEGKPELVRLPVTGFEKGTGL